MRALVVLVMGCGTSIGSPGPSPAIEADASATIDAASQEAGPDTKPEDCTAIEVPIPQDCISSNPLCATQYGQSLIASAPVYNGPYVLTEATWGYFWLDTSARAARSVPAIVQQGMCFANYHSLSNLYNGGDCNGITAVTTHGSHVYVLQSSGQCAVKTIGCGGRRCGTDPDDVCVGVLKLSLGAPAYEGMVDWDAYGSQFGDSVSDGQTADPDGCHWHLEDATEGWGKPSHFKWIRSL